MTTLNDVRPNDVIKFITTVNNSKKGQPIQEVVLKVTEITGDLIKGVNAMRSLDLEDDKKPFRSYKISNIVQNSLWKLIA